MRHENAILIELFRHKLWANAVMLEGCRDLSADQLATELAGTYGRLDETLVHLARAQGGYLRTLADWQPGPEHRLETDDPFPGVDRIAEHLRFTGERLIEVARLASADRVLKGSWSDEPYRLPEWVLLLHAAHHATEHRQQIATMLTSLGKEPPEPIRWPIGTRSRPVQFQRSGRVSSRQAVRVLLLDEADRVLLVRFWDGDRSWWCTPGGGTEPGETDEAAALREIREELGHDSVELGPCLWTRRHIGVFRGRPFDQSERIYLGRVAAFEPRLSPEAIREHGPDDIRWWTLDELTDASVEFAPRRLPALTRDIVRAGAPERPIDVSV